MSDQSQDTIIDKVRKLLAKAENPAATPEESETYFAKAQELITKWSIDELQLASVRRDDKIAFETILIGNTYYDPDVLLLHVVAINNRCRVLTSHDRKRATLIGYETDRERVKILYTSFQLFAARSAAKAVPKEFFSTGRSPKMQRFIWVRSFRDGFAHRIDHRLREAEAAAVASQPTVNTSTGVQSTALVLVDRKKQVEDYMNEQFSVGKAKGSNRRYDSSAGLAGRRAADQANLGQTGVGGSRGALGR